jgi:hypothetical protein|tara:strand:- start:51 stop:389 length:339 start_codon:yes stop_codon:yes gene_type:complete
MAVNVVRDKRYKKLTKEDVDKYLSGILHGDDIHRDWLKEATYNYFLEGEPMTAPRGAGTKAAMELALNKAKNTVSDLIGLLNRLDEENKADLDKNVQYVRKHSNEDEWVEVE